MIRNFWLPAAALVAAWSAWCQPAPLTFEVASVKAATPGPWRESKALLDRVDFSSVTLKYCVAFAYGVKEYQVSGPPWIGELKFDIVAKGPGGTRREQLPQMMQALLAQRFKLQAHTESKEFSVFALSAGKNGAKLKELPADPEAESAGAKFGMSISNGVGRLEAKNTTMTSLSNTLVRIVGGPVIDTTGLTGRYDLTLEFTPEDGRGMALAPPAGGMPAAVEPGSSVFGSLQQYGLKLEARKLLLTAIVVDAGERVPTEN
jgi:uncharacterized protein (TIGR03435 family)